MANSRCISRRRNYNQDYLTDNTSPVQSLCHFNGNWNCYITTSSLNPSWVYRPSTNSIQFPFQRCSAWTIRQWPWTTFLTSESASTL